jgi:hypothetical protein
MTKKPITMGNDSDATIILNIKTPKIRNRFRIDIALETFHTIEELDVVDGL